MAQTRQPCSPKLCLLSKIVIGMIIIDSYSFMSELGASARTDTTFVTDMGTALISGFQVLEPLNGQRLFSSQGLGEWLAFLVPLGLGC